MARDSLQASAELEQRDSMTQQRYAEVDRYIADLLVPEDPALDAALAAAAAAGLPAHDVSPPQGRLLELLARMRGARRILEIGTLAGYSTICLARGLGRGGRLVSLEIDPARAGVARANLVRAGLEDVAEVRGGPALETLLRLADEDGGPFDLVFIDADKERTPGYLGWALELTAAGKRDHCRQRRARRRARGRRERRPASARRAPLPRDGRRRAAAARDDDPDRRRQGLRRVHARARHPLRSARGRPGGRRQDSVTIVLTVEVTPSSTSTTTM
jgi:predicted O-methyltransferase YrrM